MVTGAVTRLSARVDITGGIKDSFRGSMREAQQEIASLESTSLSLMKEIESARFAYFKFGAEVAKESIRSRKQIEGISAALRDAQQAFRDATQNNVRNTLQQRQEMDKLTKSIARQQQELTQTQAGRARLTSIFADADVTDYDNKIRELKASIVTTTRALEGMKTAAVESAQKASKEADDHRQTINGLRTDFINAQRHAVAFGERSRESSLRFERTISNLNGELAETNQKLQQMVNYRDGLQRLQNGFRNLAGAVVGFAGGFAALTLISNQRLNQVQELAQSQLEAGIRSAEAIQRARRATNALGLDIFAGDEIIKEIGKEGKKKAAEAVVDPGSEQAKRIRQFLPDTPASELLERANYDPEGYARFVLEQLQRVSTDLGPAQAGLLAEVLAGETGGDYAAGLINSGMFGQFVEIYKEAIVLTDEQVAGTRRLVGAMSRLAYSFGQFTDAVGAALAPVFGPFLHWLGKALDVITQFFAENQEFATWLSVTGVAAFLLFSAAVGVASLAFFKTWVASVLATGGITGSGVAAAIASGSFWALAKAVLAATWPLLLVIAVLAGVAAAMYFLQRRVGGMKEAFFQLKDFIVLALSPLLLLLTGIMYAIEGIIRLMNLIPGVNIGTGALDDVRSFLNPVSAGQRTADRFSNPPPNQDDGSGDDDGQPGRRPPGSAPNGGLPFTLPPVSAPGGHTGLGGSAQVDNSKYESDNQYIFNTENNFYGGVSDAGQKVADDIDDKIQTIPGRKFRT